jgi:O-antigen ligase
LPAPPRLTLESGIARRISVERIPQQAALAAPVLALAAALLLAAAGHTKYATILGLCVAALPLLTYLAITTEPAITASLATVLTVFGGNWHYMHVPVPLDRLAWIATLAGLGWRALRGDARFQRLKLRPVHIVLLTAVLYVVCSATLSGSLTNGSAIVGLLDTFGVVPFLLFFFAPAVFPTARERNCLLVALVVLGLYLGLTAWFEGVSLNSLVFPRYILDPSIGEHFGRARGPFLEAAGNGLALFICAAASLLAFRTWSSRGARGFAATVGVLCIGGVIFTLTREAWLGVILASIIVGLATPELRRYVIPGLAVAAVIVVAVIVLVPSFQVNASTRIATNRSLWDRENADSAALRMFEARPIFGFGWSTYAEHVAPYYRLSGSYPLTTVGAIHNEFVSNLVELGLVGAGLWVAGLIMGVCAPLVRRGPPGARRMWESLLLGVLVCWLVVANFTPQDYAFANATLWLLAGIVASISPLEPSGGWSRGA